MNLSEIATTSRADRPVERQDHSAEFENLLLAEGLATEEQLTRARRVSARLQEPKSVGEVLVDLGQLTRSEHDRLVHLYRSKLGIARVLFEDAVLDENGLTRYETAKSKKPNLAERDVLLGEGLVTE